jgi:hypothetical protein
MFTTHFKNLEDISSTEATKEEMNLLNLFNYFLVL